MSAPHSVLDVAEYILRRKPGVSTLKLQKLCYYAQAWSLVWDGEPLFGEKVQAWANGPVVRELYDAHKGEFRVRSVDGDPDALRPEAVETVEAVLEAYGDKEGEFLSELTHSESPWRSARQRAGLKFGRKGDPEITLQDMRRHYGRLYDRASED